MLLCGREGAIELIAYGARKRIILVSDERTYIPNSDISPIQAPIELSRLVFPITILPIGVHFNFVREVPQDLQCLPKIFAICVVNDISKHLDILTWEIGALWERPPMLLECRQILHQLLLRHKMIILQ